MTNEEVNLDLLLQYLDGRLGPVDAAKLDERLAREPGLRKAMVEIAEMAVNIGDLARMEDERKVRLSRLTGTGAEQGNAVPSLSDGWVSRKALGILLTFGLIAMVGVSAFAYAVKGRSALAQVENMTGALHYIESSGVAHDALDKGVGLYPGDTIESRSCDSWITLSLLSDAKLTIAGNTSVRVMQATNDQLRFELLKGSLWFSPPSETGSRQIVVATPVFEVAFGDSLLNIQTSSTESIVRVDRGTAQVTRRLDGSLAETGSGQQIHLHLGNRDPLEAVQQPSPVDRWATQQMKGGEEIFGIWLNPMAGDAMRIGASPLLWPVPQRDPVMLYVISIPAWRCSQKPVALHDDSVLRFRGRMERPRRVRFGFSAQKMYGVFAGKFEIDIPASMLGKSGEVWEVMIPLRDFQPLNPYLSTVPDGLELNDVYALTIVDHAGLEITEMELFRMQGEDGRTQ
ncbi:MAG: hypothetical protein ACK57Y_13475 [Pirellulaceae bacterium]